VEADEVPSALFAFTAAGERDSGFGNGGTAVLPTEAGRSAPIRRRVLYGSIGSQANGTLVAAGTDGRYTVLARMLTNGRVDQAFSGDGIAPALVRAASYLPSREVELDRDGKILITGTRPYEDDLVVASSFLKAQQPPGSSRSSRRSRFQEGWCCSATGASRPPGDGERGRGRQR
jgi:hypothetical protein